jgi:uncharacterized protein YcbK (DUF882 family)
MSTHPSRRHFLHRSLRQAAGLAGAAAAPALLMPARAATAPRSLALVHTHTQETIDVCYARGGQYDPAALASLDHFLRDHYSGAVGRIDPALHDLLHRLRQTLGSSESYQVISGYRAPATNANLKATRGGGVATRSLHMTGQAIDVRLPGTALSDLRDAALSLKGGGVGYYARSQFVHLDTGRVRRW